MTKVTDSRIESILIFCGASALSIVSMEIGEQAVVRQLTDRQLTESQLADKN